MKTILRIIVVLGFIATTSMSWAEIYKWVDEKGTVHFTEDPGTIPEKYRDKTSTRNLPESSPKNSSSSGRNPSNRYNSQRHIGSNGVINKPQDCRSPGETETAFFLTRYCGGARTAIAHKCREILKECCNYNHTEFAELVDKGAKDAKWNVIPERIPALLRRHCGQSEPTTFETATPVGEGMEDTKKCWNCDGKGWIGKEVMEAYGGRPTGDSFYIRKTCSICNGTGYVKK